MKIRRIMTASVSSGSGKTLITCGLLRLLQKKGYRVASFKCGPDFIDPMFHEKVLGEKSLNLDPYLAGPSVCRMLLAEHAEHADLSVMEGVMGFYDGISPASSEGGASDLAAVTDTPVLLIVPARGMSRSALALIRGFLDFGDRSVSKPFERVTSGKRIRGLILNRVSRSFYPVLKDMIEKETGIPVVGYVPVLDDSMTLESRHLGLVLPDEIRDFQQKLDRLAALMEETVDLSKILSLADEACDLPDEEIAGTEEQMLKAVRGNLPCTGNREMDKLRIAVAEDEAFCFLYEDNLALLRKAGAEPVPFSPMHDAHLPEKTDGLILPGGYPELHAEELSRNTGMREEIRKAVVSGLPTHAECGGFLYLHRVLVDPDGRAFPMAGVFPGRVRNTGHLTRFGYASLSGAPFFGIKTGPVRVHEFHYYESDDPGTDFLAEKPSGKRAYRCGFSRTTLYAGFPHIYYPAEPRVAGAFLRQCAVYHEQEVGSICRT